MTRNTSTQFHPARLPSIVWIQTLSWLGGLSVLSGGIALAQAPAKDLVIPTSEAPALTVAPTSEAPASDPALAPTAAPPDVSIPAPIAPEAKATSAPEATDTYDQPAAIIFSERSTGCQDSIRFGQGVTYGPCGAPKPPEPQPVAVSPNLISAAAPSVEMGSLTVSAAGGGLSVGTTPSVREYYHRTVRPPAQLGNGNIRLIFPLSIPAIITSAFGWRIHPISGAQRFHSGTDLDAPMGTPVLAAYAGRVAIADFFGGYGLAVALDHNQGSQQTLYGHLSEIFVKPGEWVKQGEVIGRVGSTGASTGPHLHFEFRQQTSEGWVAMDAGQQLEYAMAQLVKALQPQTAQAPAKPQG